MLLNKFLHWVFAALFGEAIKIKLTNKIAALYLGNIIKTVEFKIFTTSSGRRHHHHQLIIAVISHPCFLATWLLPLLYLTCWSRLQLLGVNWGAGIQPFRGLIFRQPMVHILNRSNCFSLLGSLFKFSFPISSYSICILESFLLWLFA